jgi:flagellar biosynthesis/type III secretory pathway M-ring protein FliF/YscJ
MSALATLLPVAAPALPLDEAGKYVAGAYVVFLVLLLVYVSIMAIRLQRIDRELRELAAFAEARQHPEVPIEDEGTAPGRGSEDQSVSVSSAARGSRGGGA